mmetsp:Transcript_51782/g.169305  ORF Transcript_51782/g.169305 Transcript_51782/m.169305 type:complete len:265 (-) Transcript_51782:479-1273(-)
MSDSTTLRSLAFSSRCSSRSWVVRGSRTSCTSPSAPSVARSKGAPPRRRQINMSTSPESGRPRRYEPHATTSTAADPAERGRESARAEHQPEVETRRRTLLHSNALARQHAPHRLAHRLGDRRHLRPRDAPPEVVTQRRAHRHPAVEQPRQAARACSIEVMPSSYSAFAGTDGGVREGANRLARGRTHTPSPRMLTMRPCCARASPPGGSWRRGGCSRSRPSPHRGEAARSRAEFHSCRACSPPSPDPSSRPCARTQTCGTPRD